MTQKKKKRVLMTTPTGKKGGKLIKMTPGWRDNEPGLEL